MKKIVFALTIIPSLFLGLDVHLSSLQDTLKAQSQISFHLIKMLFDGRQEDHEVSLISGFNYAKESSYTAQKGSVSLLSRSEDDSVIIPYLNYIYTDLKDADQKLTSHSISGGIKSMIETDFLSIIAGASVGGNFDAIPSLSINYSYLFVNAQLGLGREISMFGSRLKVTPIAYADYGYIYQKSLKDISTKEQNFHTLSALAGGQSIWGFSNQKAQSSRSSVMDFISTPLLVKKS